MHKNFEAICESLDRLANLAVTSFPQNNDQLFTDYWGWQVPTINRRDLAWMIKSIADDLREAGPENVSEELGPLIAQIPARIEILRASTLPTAYNGNVNAFAPLLDSIRYIRQKVLPEVGWVSVPIKGSMPVPLRRRLSVAEGHLKELETDIPNLSKKVESINAAHLVAENLEVDLQALVEAREAVETTFKQVKSNSAVVEEIAAKSGTTLEETQSRAESLWNSMKQASDSAVDDAKKRAQVSIENMAENEQKAQKLIAQCEAAYHITTTKGLAGAFDQRASSLAWSMRGWVIALAMSLIAGSWIGGERLAKLATVLAESNRNWPAIVSDALLSLLGVCAPLWFAWLATKQIGQRFRLSEDYAFKASISKAYEGYRKEAAMLDPDFQATLFRSALTRLDEAPLRLVETEHHGSPWAEFFNSDTVKQAMKIAPDLPAQINGLINNTIQKAKETALDSAKNVEAAKNIILPDNVKKPD